MALYPNISKVFANVTAQDWIRPVRSTHASHQHDSESAIAAIHSTFSEKMSLAGCQILWQGQEEGSKTGG